MSATHNGTCQVCGRLQAFANGGIAKHGYTVEHHYFQGTCPGSHHLALEMDRTFADEVAASIRKQAAEEAQIAKDLKSGKKVPKEAKNGKQERYERQTPFGLRTSWRAAMVPFREAPLHYQEEAVTSAVYRHESQSKYAAETAQGIVKRADDTTGKKELSKRNSEVKKEVTIGSVVHIGGKDGITVTVIRIEHKTCWGCGPHLNGQYLPHIVYEYNGKERHYLLRHVRQANIVR